VAGVGGKGGVIALRVVTGDGAVEAGEDLLAVHVADGGIALARLGNDDHFALKGDVCLGVARAAADACAAGNFFLSFFVYAGFTAGRVHSGSTSLVAADGDFVAISSSIIYGINTAADACGTSATGGVDRGVSFDGHITQSGIAAAITAANARA